MPKLYTKTGDRGETGLLYGGRVPKTDARVEAYGALDEAISCMGLARALARSPRVQEILKDVQRECFTVGAELATDPRQYERFQAHFSPVTPAMTARLEQLIDTLEAEVKLPRAFIIPGASQGSAALDVARTALRRAERRSVVLKERELLTNEEILRYLNRLADLLFMLARYEDKDLPFELLTAEG